MTKSSAKRDSKEKTLVKQKRFAREYVIDRNATRAAIAVGYSEKSAKSAGHRLLTYVDVKAMIAELEKKILEKLEYTAQDVHKEIHRLAFYDMRILFKEDGTLRPFHELSYEESKLIKKSKRTQIFEGFGKNRKYVGDMVEIEFIDRHALLQSCAKLHGLFIQKLEVHNGRNLGEEMREAEQRLKEARENETK